MVDTTTSMMNLLQIEGQPMSEKNLMNKTRPVENPYARWFCAVKSPNTYGSWEYGDTYARDVQSVAIKVDTPF